MVLCIVARFQVQRGDKEPCDKVACAICVAFISDRAWLNSFLEGDSYSGHYGNSLSRCSGAAWREDGLWLGSSGTFGGLERI